jgi:hypothetical protein
VLAFSAHPSTDAMPRPCAPHRLAQIVRRHRPHRDLLDHGAPLEPPRPLGSVARLASRTGLPHHSRGPADLLCGFLRPSGATTVSNP